MKIIRILLGILLAFGILTDNPIAYILIGLYVFALVIAEKMGNKALVNLLSSEKVEPLTSKRLIGTAIFALVFIVVGIIIFLTNGMKLW